MGFAAGDVTCRLAGVEQAHRDICHFGLDLFPLRLYVHQCNPGDHLMGPPGQRKQERQRLFLIPRLSEESTLAGYHGVGPDDQARAQTRSHVLGLGQRQTADVRHASFIGAGHLSAIAEHARVHAKREPDLLKKDGAARRRRGEDDLEEQP